MGASRRAYVSGILIYIGREGKPLAEKKNIDKQKLEEQKAYNEYVKEVRNPIKQVKREIYLLKELLHIYGVYLWIDGYVLFVNMNSPVESEYTINDQSEIDDILHLRRNQVLTKNQIEKIISILK